MTSPVSRTKFRLFKVTQNFAEFFPIIYPLVMTKGQLAHNSIAQHLKSFVFQR